MIKPRVFISYSHDSDEHIDRVLNLANTLRYDGVDANLDLYVESPPEGWPRWMENQICEATYVLVVCTEIYYHRFAGREVPGHGLGATWEGAIITQELYESSLNNSKFIPVLLNSNDSQWIPRVLKSVTHYYVTNLKEYEILYRRLTEQPSIEVPPLGSGKMMPPLDCRQMFKPVVTSVNTSATPAKQSGTQGVTINGTHGTITTNAFEIPNFHIPEIKKTIKEIAIREYDSISNFTADFLLQIGLAWKKPIPIPPRQLPMSKDIWSRVFCFLNNVWAQQAAERRSWFLTEKGRKLYDALFVDNDSVTVDQIIGEALLRNPIIGLIVRRFIGRGWHASENIVAFLKSKGISCWPFEIERLLEELSIVGIVACSTYNKNFRMSPFLKMPD
jgi:hypothetical protein